MSRATELNGARTRTIGVPRGPRAESDQGVSTVEVNAAIERMARSFEEFKTQNDARLKGIEDGRGDAVQDEHVERINIALTDQQKALDAIAAQVASPVRTAEDAASEVVAANRDAFKGFLRGKLNEEGYQASIKPEAIQAAGTTDSDPDGGFLVPGATEDSITRIVGTRSLMRNVARVLSISTQSYKVPKSLGGTASGWVGERDSRAATAGPTVSEITIPTHEIYAMPKASQTLLDDAAMDIAGWYAEEVGIEFEEQEGSAFITGDGVEKPKGFLGSSYTKVANASWAWGKVGFIASGDATTIDDSDEILDLVYSLKQAYRQNASFLMNDLTTAAVRKLKDGDGNYIWQPSAQPGEPAQLFGYAHRSDENMPDQGANTYPLAFGDFGRGYTIVDRIGVRVLRDPYTDKPYVAFYTTKRVGGGISDFQAIKLMKCST